LACAPCFPLQAVSVARASHRLPAALLRRLEGWSTAGGLEQEPRSIVSRLAVRVGVGAALAAQRGHERWRLRMAIDNLICMGR
jgi:hypothetical protein